MFGEDLRPWFEVVGAGDVVPKKKPAPDIYAHVLERLGLAGNSCLALEDSQHGLRSALGAGIPTLVTVSDYTADQDFTGALLVVDHLGEPGLAATCLSASPRETLGMVDVEMLRRLHERRIREAP